MKNKNSDLTVSNNSNQNLLYNFTKIFKMNRILFLIIFLISSNNFYSQDVPTSERNALISIFNNMNGTNWSAGSKLNWNTSNPVSTWAGVNVFEDDNGQFHVYLLELLDNNLKGSIPTSIQNLPYLNRIFIGSGSISSIPTEIGNLTYLNELLIISSGSIQLPTTIQNLDNLNLIRLEATTGNIILPSTFGNLKNLNTLMLSAPLLSSFPSSTTSLKNTLTHLEIDNNKISTFPSEISDLLNLQYLRFTYNGNSTSIPTNFSNLSKLEFLSIIDTNKKITCDNSTFFSSFPNLNTISFIGVNTSKYFDLSQNKMLKTVLIDSEKLEVVNFSNGTNSLTNNFTNKFGNTLLKNIKCISVDNPTNAQSGILPYNYWTVNWYNNTKNYLSDCSAFLSTTNISKPILKIFPNPVKNIVYIESEGNKINGEIYSTNGQLLKLVSSKEINISDLKKGIYVLKLNTENGILTQKIIKE